MESIFYFKFFYEVFFFTLISCFLILIFKVNPMNYFLNFCLQFRFEVFNYETSHFLKVTLILTNFNFSYYFSYGKANEVFVQVSEALKSVISNNYYEHLIYCASLRFQENSFFNLKILFINF